MSGGPIAPGAELGPYTIVGLIGAGGMGEVYRARDSRLGRDVAVKVLPSALAQNADALARFETEARAASALAHPNVVVIFDVGRHEGTSYVVSELLEGDTLNARLREGPLPMWRAVEWARQIAAGLAAVHERGILHRDLKPDNVFVTTDGVVKILDFGLAKLIGHRSSAHEDTAPVTQPGAVIGTAAYMAPEQVQGAATDHRADIFSLGLILYEMLAGRRAFVGSPPELVAAILRDDPVDLVTLRPEISPALVQVVRHCLEKRPADRFQSTRDLAFALGSLSAATGPPPMRPPPRRRGLHPAWLAAGAIAVAAATVAAFALRRGREPGTAAAAVAPAPRPPAPPPEWRRLTYGRGPITVARFAQGDAFLFNRFSGLRTVRTYLARTDGRDARPILDQLAVLGLSRGGELAVLTDATFLTDTAAPAHGTLARMPLAGSTAPRPMLEDVAGADWSPDGTRLAAVQVVRGRYRVMYPVGNATYEAPWGLSHLRVSPSGREVAFIEHPYPGDDRGYVSYVDADGRKHKLTDDFASAWGLAWSPAGDEVWFTAAASGLYRELRAVTLASAQRVLARAPAVLTLHDVDAAGRVLVSVEARVRHVKALRPGAQHEVDVASFEWASVGDLSDDGKTVVLIEQSDPSSPEYRLYLSRDGSPGVFLAEGADGTLSPDGKWVLVSSFSHPDELTLVPIGPGLARKVARGGLAVRAYAEWFPDGKRIAFAGNDAGKEPRIYVRDLDSGDERAISGEGVLPAFFAPVSPDGAWVVGVQSTGATMLYPSAGGEPRPIKGLEPDDVVVQWTPDGGSLYVKVGEAIPCAIVRLDPRTGKRTRWRELRPAELDGVVQVRYLAMTPNGDAYVYELKSMTSDLFLVTGIGGHGDSP